MRMHLVVVGEPDRQLLKNGEGVWRGVNVHVVALEGFDERLRHAVALRRAIGGTARLETDVLGKTACLPSNVAGPVVAQPFCRARQPGNLSKALAHRFHHYVPNELAAEAGSCRCKGDRLAIAAIEAEGHAHPLAVAASDLKAIGAI